HHPSLQTGKRISKDSRLRRFIQAHSRGGNRGQVENPWRDNLRSTRGFRRRGGSQRQALDWGSGVNWRKTLIPLITVSSLASPALSPARQHDIFCCPCT